MPYIYSFRKKLLIGAGTGLWLIAFLVFIAPFDASDLTMTIRIRIMVVYGLIFLVCYMIIAALEWFVFVRSKYWPLQFEILSYLLLYTLVFFPTIVYYKSGIVNGDYTVIRFLYEQYIPILIIITPVLFLLKKIAVKTGNERTLTIKGENKRDFLRLSKDELVSISSSDNYIEVVYQKGEGYHKRLIRTTLKSIESDFPFLKRVHRSHLINADHFVEWSDKGTIIVAGNRIPVSKKYRENIPD